MKKNCTQMAIGEIAEVGTAFSKKRLRRNTRKGGAWGGEKPYESSMSSWRGK